MAIVQLVTSLRRDEVDEIERLATATGTRLFRRAGMLRAMLRFALHNQDEFRAWMKETDGKPEAGGEVWPP